MTYLYYNYRTWNNSQTEPQIPEETIKMWERVAKKSNWRIVELPNGYFQTECLGTEKEGQWEDVTRRETIEGAERAIASSIEHYKKKLKALQGPKVVKTFK